MANLAENSFSSYLLTEDEFTEGSILTITQRQVIHNRLVSAMEQKMSLELDTNNLNGYLQTEAALAGEIGAYRSILDMSAVAIEEKANPNLSE